MWDNLVAFLLENNLISAFVFILMFPLAIGYLIPRGIVYFFFCGGYLGGKIQVISFERDSIHI